MKNENENENENLRDIFKEKFEEIVKVEFNDFVFESMLSMINKYETSPAEMKNAFCILNKNLNKLKTYDDLKAYELNQGGQLNDRKSKYAREYENEDESTYQKPTEEQLRRVRELLESN